MFGLVSQKRYDDVVLELEQSKSAVVARVNELKHERADLSLLKKKIEQQKKELVYLDERIVKFREREAAAKEDRSARILQIKQLAIEAKANTAKIKAEHEIEIDLLRKEIIRRKKDYDSLQSDFEQVTLTRDTRGRFLKKNRNGWK